MLVVQRSPHSFIAKELHIAALDFFVTQELVIRARDFQPAWLDEEGNPTEVRVVRGLLDSMDAAALEAVRKWRFQPATRHGKPVRVVFRVTVDFKL